MRKTALKGIFAQETIKALFYRSVAGKLTYLVQMLFMVVAPDEVENDSDEAASKKLTKTAS